MHLVNRRQSLSVTIVHPVKILMRRDEANGFPESDSDWDRLVTSRRSRILEFLSWADGREAKKESLRLDNREDLARAREILELFGDDWWAVVVYSCFDSITGTKAVAPYFRRPLPAGAALSRLASLKLPRGSVQHHRTQPGHKGAKTALLAACARVGEFRAILHKGIGFDQRYEAFRALKAPQWSRTTCFDLLIRAGLLGVAGGKTYRPVRAYLRGSTGPSKGFEAIWGIKVTPGNAESCEELLRGWTARWASIGDQVGASWEGSPYDSGDLENALCVFQELEGAGGGRLRDGC